MDVRDNTLWLAPLFNAPQALKRDHAVELRVASATGVVVLSGTLRDAEKVVVRGVSHQAVQVEVDPDSLHTINRRSAFRVSVQLKGQIAVFTSDESVPFTTPNKAATPSALSGQRNLEDLAHQVTTRKRPCIVRDLSLGGVRLATEPPPARPGQVVLVDILLEKGNVLRNLSGSVVEAFHRGGSDPFSTMIRVQFAPLPSKIEARLSRLIHQVQLEDLRQGIRNRREPL